MTRQLIATVFLLLSLATTGGLTGCAAPATTSSMVMESVAVMQKHPFTVSVRTQGGYETGAMDVSSISNEDFAKAIEASILSSGLFTQIVPLNASDYTLNVAIVYLSKPLFGTDFTVDMEAAWSLVDTTKKTVVMRESIKSSYTATMGDAFVGATRFRLAVEGAARENICAGLLAIGKLKLPAP